MPSLIPVRSFIGLAWHRYTSHLGRFLEVSLWLLVPSILQLAFLFLATTPAVGWELQTVWTANLLVSRLLSLAIAIWVSIRLAKLALARDPKEEGYIATHPRIGWNLFLPCLWINILNGLALIGGGILVLPAIWLVVANSFATFVLVDQDLRGLQALYASFALVRRRWWPVLGRLLLVGLTFLVLTFLVLIILSLVLNTLFGSALSTEVDRLTRGLLIDNVLSVQALRGFAVGQLRDGLLMALTIPFLAGAQGLLYKSLKETYQPQDAKAAT